MRRWRAVLCASLAMVASGCETATDELRGLAELPPLDYAVLVTGGAFLAPDAPANGTFGGAAAGPDGSAATDEPIPIRAVLDVLDRGAVFQRVALDADDASRRVRSQLLQHGGGDAELREFLQRARDDGFDLLLVVEQLIDGPIEAQGTNSRWLVTFAAWILLGFGAMIPDHTFESRATLRVTVRDLQTGRVLHDPLLAAGPVELALTERSDVWGLVESILVPPFWVGDDPEAVGAAVRETTQRRLLLSLARDLKSELVRRRLRERAAASVQLLPDARGPRLVVDSAESITVARLRGERTLDTATAAAFEQALVASSVRIGEHFHYEATLPAAFADLRLQVLVGTIGGNVSSATFGPQGAP